MENMLAFHPGPRFGWHEREIFAAVTTHSHTLKSFDIANEKEGFEIQAYPTTTSNVFANDVHRTSSPMLNRPLAIRSLPIEFT